MPEYNQFAGAQGGWREHSLEIEDCTRRVGLVATCLATTSQGPIPATGEEQIWKECLPVRRIRCYGAKAAPENKTWTLTERLTLVWILDYISALRSRNQSGTTLHWKDGRHNMALKNSTS
jgi:hypothetical protein